MQTFLPLPNVTETAKVLDYKRLGKQRVEVKQIYRALTVGGGWKNHPAVKMWEGYENFLLVYGILICDEWRSRGFKDSLLDEFCKEFQKYVRSSIDIPPWFGDEDFHLSHRSNLIRKMPSHYRKFWPDDPNNLPYVWPGKGR